MLRVQLPKPLDALFCFLSVQRPDQRVARVGGAQAQAAILQDLVVNQDRASKPKSVKVVETYKTDEKYGFAIEKDNDKLVTTINEGLQKTRDDGTYDRLYAKYFPKIQP